MACGAAPLPRVGTRRRYWFCLIARTSIAGANASAMPTHRRAHSRAQGQFQAEPGGLFFETHGLVYGQHRAVFLVVPGLDVVDAQALGVADGFQLQSHRQALAASLAANTREALPDKGRVLDRALQVLHAEPAAVA